MPTYKVLHGQTVYTGFVSIVEAETKEQAEQLAPHAPMKFEPQERELSPEPIFLAIEQPGG